MTITIRNVELPDKWQLDPPTLAKLYGLRRHQLLDATRVWEEAERLVAQHYHRPALSGASSFQEAS